MKRIPLAFTTAVLLFIMGCVVIPDTFEARIYIDIRHVEEQAEGLLNYVEGKSDVLPGLGAEATDDTSWLRRTLDFVSPIRIAHAAELKDTSPLVSQIANKMKSRYQDVVALKKTGAAGESKRGLVELVKPELLADDDTKNAAQQLIAAENADRKALYKEVARLNRDQDLDVSTVERVYARKRLERAASGDLFQLPGAGKDFDTFKSSPQGRKLGAACVPDSWVTIK